MKRLLLLGMLTLLCGCITINFNRGSQPSDNKPEDTRQNSGDDEIEDCDEQIRSAARLAASAQGMARPSQAVTGQLPSGNQQDNCLEDEAELPRKHLKANQRSRQLRLRRGMSISASAPVGNAQGRQTPQNRSLSSVILVTD